ncbi:TetR/AcrR family transcriptional regulator [Rathayibacter soli]|uniref:TetR/AcrR family transcriptional regulator n=1 Tax=Rathayibacter soli TaxID=3144168 RepID=UPI0027E5B247|nr:TetR/AcrR family transcriptional regulator [Glaciibacter superstes]
MTDATELKRGRPGYDQRAVLTIAVAAFNEFGYDATSMGVLAKRLGLSKSAIYHHFAAKEDILELALDEALTALEAVLVENAPTENAPTDNISFERMPAETVPTETEPDAATSAADRLAAVLRGAVAVLVDKLPSVTLLLRVRGNTDVERRALTRRRAFDRAVAALVVQARDEGSLRSDIDPAIVSRLLFGMINSIVEWYRPGGPVDAETLAGDVLTVALDGLRTPSVGG